MMITNSTRTRKTDYDPRIRSDHRQALKPGPAGTHCGLKLRIRAARPCRKRQQTPACHIIVVPTLTFEGPVTTTPNPFWRVAPSYRQLMDANITPRVHFTIDNPTERFTRWLIHEHSANPDQKPQGATDVSFCVRRK